MQARELLWSEPAWRPDDSAGNVRHAAAPASAAQPGLPGGDRRGDARQARADRGAREQRPLGVAARAVRARLDSNATRRSSVWIPATPSTSSAGCFRRATAAPAARSATLPPSWRRRRSIATSLPTARTAAPLRTSRLRLRWRRGICPSPRRLERLWSKLATAAGPYLRARRAPRTTL